MEMQIPEMSAVDAAFGADLSAYPARDSIPEPHRSESSAECRIASKLFFEGGKLADHGRRLKSGVDSGQFHCALQALLGSFAPSHEHKIATCGWLIAEHTEAS